MSSTPLVTHTGGCHCKAVQYTILAPEVLTITNCNCSICSMKGYLHLIVPATHFTLTHGSTNLSEYTFGTHTARHLFCKTCGIASFYVPRSHPDGFSVNFNCLDKEKVKEWTVKKFDGRDSWEESAKEIRGVEGV